MIIRFSESDDQLHTENRKGRNQELSSQLSRFQPHLNKNNM